MHVVKKLEILDNIKDSNLLEIVVRAVGRYLLLSDKLPALFWIMGAMIGIIIATVN